MLGSAQESRRTACSYLCASTLDGRAQNRLKNRPIFRASSAVSTMSPLVRLELRRTSSTKPASASMNKPSTRTWRPISDLGDRSANGPSAINPSRSRPETQRPSNGERRDDRTDRPRERLVVTLVLIDACEDTVGDSRVESLAPAHVAAQFPVRVDATRPFGLLCRIDRSV